MVDEVFSNGTVPATEVEIREANSFINKTNLRLYIQDGNHPLLDAIRTASDPNGTFALLKVTAPINSNTLTIRFKIAEATLPQTKHMLKLMMARAILNSGTIQTSTTNKVTITLVQGKKWADDIEFILGEYQ